MNYLLFVDGADDAAMFPASGIQSITCAANATVLVKFAPGSLGTGQAASVDVVTLTVTADTEASVMKAIAQAANAPVIQGGVITVADDVNSVYLVDDITACDIALDAA